MFLKCAYCFCWHIRSLFVRKRIISTGCQDTSTYKDPHHYPTGIPHVLVNGVEVIKNGEHTGAKAGQPLRHVYAPR